MLLHDHPEGHNNIQDNYKNELFVVELKHHNMNVYIIKPFNGKGPMHTVNWQQLFDLQKLQGSDIPSNPTHDIKLPTLLVRKPTRGVTTPQHVHPDGTRSKTKANSKVLQSSSEDETEEVLCKAVLANCSICLGVDFTACVFGNALQYTTAHLQVPLSLQHLGRITKN